MVPAFESSYIYNYLRISISTCTNPETIMFNFSDYLIIIIDCSFTIPQSFTRFCTYNCYGIILILATKASAVSNGTIVLFK